MNFSWTQTFCMHSVYHKCIYVIGYFQGEAEHLPVSSVKENSKEPYPYPYVLHGLSRQEIVFWSIWLQARDYMYLAIEFVKRLSPDWRFPDLSIWSFMNHNTHGQYFIWIQVKLPCTNICGSCTNHVSHIVSFLKVQSCNITSDVIFTETQTKHSTSEDVVLLKPMDPTWYPPNTLSTKTVFTLTRSQWPNLNSTKVNQTSPLGYYCVQLGPLVSTCAHFGPHTNNKGW